MAPMPRVMHVITGLASGGAETMLLKPLSARTKDFEVLVMTLDQKELTLEPAIRQLGVSVCNLGLRRSIPSPRVALAVRRTLLQFRPHVIQGWMPHGNLVASFAGILSRPRVPVLWNIRMSLSESREEPLRTRAIIRFAARLSWHPQVIIYNSQSGARQHEALGYRASKRVFIPNGFDCQLFRPNQDARRRVRCELGVAEDALLIGMVARNHPMKDHSNFLRAAAIIASRYPLARFVLVGTGVTAQDQVLANTIAQHQLTHKTFLLGQRPDIPRLTAALDVACSTSFWGEGFSNAVGEAMACGVPCVVTDIGDSAGIVANTGLIVPARNPEAFAQSLAQLIEAGTERRRELGILARQRVEENFSLDVIVRRYEDLYRQLMMNSVPLPLAIGTAKIDK